MELLEKHCGIGLIGAFSNSKSANFPAVSGLIRLR